MIDQVFEFYKHLKGMGIIFCSTGPLTHEVVENLAATLRAKVELKEGRIGLSMKVFSIFVEQVQNMVHYSEDKVVQDHPRHVEYKQGICMIGQEDEHHYFIISGNLIRNEDVERIESKIITLRQMDGAELKAFYLAQRKMGPDAQSKGAGLGLIDMMRKASDMDYHFHKVDDQFTFFVVKVRV
ncbi:MAG: SiaB family protein kinase [Magnetococcus sp. YQC-5]